MKKVFLFAMILFIGFAVKAQVTAKYVSETLLNLNLAGQIVTTDKAYDIQVDGQNYMWYFACTWDTSHTHSTVFKVQLSYDGTNWKDYTGKVDTIKTTVGMVALWGEDVPANHIRPWLDVTSGDTLRWIKIVYSLKKR